MAYTKINTNTNKLECRLCPHNCNISDGRSGLCSVRKNSNMNLELPYEGILTALNIDPIEKKPLYHFYPGSKVFSIGFFGCNFHCQFCQNYQISQEINSNGNKQVITPLELVNLAAKEDINFIAYTYSEPVIHFEYILECSKIAHSKNIKNVLVTNGFLNKAPAQELLAEMDGVNIDLKSFTNDFYRELGGEIEPVKEFIKLSSGLAHTEITTLIIPGKNDSFKEIEDIANFIASVNKNIPLHISSYYPTYNYKISSTPEKTVLSLVNIALGILNYVYPGNIGNREVNTYCSNCGNILIKRNGYFTSIKGIKDNKCSNCGTKLSFPTF